MWRVNIDYIKQKAITCIHVDQFLWRHWEPQMNTFARITVVTFFKLIQLDRDKDVFKTKSRSGLGKRRNPYTNVCIAL